MVVVADGCPTPKSATTARRLSQTHSTIVVKAVLYLASQLEVATVGCFLLNHDMYELPSMKQNPLVGTRECHSNQPDQNLKKHVNLVAVIPPWDKTTQGAWYHSSSKRVVSLLPANA